MSLTHILNVTNLRATHKKVSTVTNNKIVKTLYDDIPSNENISLYITNLRATH